MCSINEEIDDAIELIPEERYQYLDDALCQKCNLEKALLQLRGKDVYCNSCFLTSATHKFRATLGKSKIVRPTDKVLVAYSGNAGSTALLHLIRAGMHESVHKRLVFETKVVFIDDGVAKGHSLEDRRRRVDEIRQQIDPLGFESYGASLDESLIETDNDIEKLEKFSSSLTESSTTNETLKNIFDKLSDYTSKVELLRRLRRKLILSSARKLKCTKVFLSDDATSLAIDILSNVAQGRGAQLSADVGFLDARYDDIIMLRPMRDFTRHELNCYLNIHKLETVHSDVPEESSPRSIQSLTEKFVTDLDSRFNGTVSTVFRTGEKVCAISPDESDKNSDETCVLCTGTLDTAASDTVISVIQATAFSRLVSSQGPSGNIHSAAQQVIKEVACLSLRTNATSKDCCSNCNDTCGHNNYKQVKVTSEDLNKLLCYGCRLIFSNSDTCDVPSCVLNAAIQRLALGHMRNEINDFLL